MKEAVEKKAKNSRRATKYRSSNHLVTTSNIVEQLFRRAKLIMRADGTPAFGAANLFALQQIIMERSYH